MIGHFGLLLGLVLAEAKSSGASLGVPRLLVKAPDLPDRLVVAFSGEVGEGSIAALRLDDGKVLWKKKVEPPLLLRAAGAFVVTSWGLGLLAAWNASSGKQVWSRNLGSRMLDVFLADLHGRKLIAVAAGSLELIDAATGASDWTVEADTRFLGGAHSRSDEDVCTLSVAESTDGSVGVVSTRRDLHSGKALSRSHAPAAVVDALERGPDNFQVLPGHVATLDVQAERLELYNLCGESDDAELELDGFFDMKAVRTRPPKDPFLLPWPRSPGIFAGGNEAFTFFFRANARAAAGQRLSFQWINNAVGPVGPLLSPASLGGAKADEAVTVVPRDATLLELRIVGRKDADPLKFVSPSVSARPTHVLGWETAKEARTHCAVILSDGTLLVVNATEVAWSRAPQTRQPLASGRPEL